MAGRDLFAEQPKLEAPRTDTIQIQSAGGRDLFADELAAGPFLSAGEQRKFEAFQDPNASPEVRQEIQSTLRSTKPDETVKQMFTGELRETELTKTLPEFRETDPVQTFELGLKGARMGAGLLTSFTTDGQIKVIKEAIPESRFFRDSKGNIIVDVDGEKSVLNSPGFSPQDVTRALFSFLAFLPTSRAASLVNTTRNKLLVGGVGSAATEQGIQEVSRIAGSEEERSLGKTALAGVLGAAGEAITPARQSLAESKFARQTQIRPQDISAQRETVDIAQEAARETGIPLTRAQQVATPELIEKQSFLAQLPASNQKAAEVLTRQNKAASDAVQELLETIAPPESITTGAKRFRTAAQKEVEIKNRASTEAASPIYKQAFRRQREGKQPLINTGKLKTKIRKMSRQFDPGDEIEQRLTKAFNKISAAEGNLQRLHMAKIELDQQIGKFGGDAVGKTTKRFLTDVKNDLVNVLVDQSPSYRAAREQFIKNLPDIDPVISKIADIKDIDLKRISRIVFDPAETNPEVVLNSKKVIDSLDPEAWNELLRVELERRIGDMSSDIAEGGLLATENTPAFLRKAIFGPPENPKARRVLYSAVNPEQAKNLRFLETALKRASLGRPGGSQTAIRKEIEKELSGGVMNSIRNFFKSPVKELADTGNDAAFNIRVRSMADAIFNPEYVTEMKEIRKLSPNTAAASKAMTQLLNKINQQIEQIDQGEQ